MANLKTTIGSQGVISSQVVAGTNSSLNINVPVNLASTTGNIPTISTATSHIYVSDINGSDSNSGLSATEPLKTLAAAVALLPSIIKHDVVIHVGAHGGSGYTWATIDGHTLIDGASIYVVGDGAGQSGEDGFTVVVGPSLALAGSDDTKVVSAALAVDAYFGNTIEILTGAATGDRRTIKENTATDILPPAKFTAAVAAGDSYRIVRPSVAIATTGGFTSTLVVCANIGTPCAGVSSALVVPNVNKRSALVLVNLKSSTFFTGATQNSLVQLFGVELSGVLESSGELNFGVTSFGKAHLPALVVGNTAWHGWGLYVPSSFLFLYGGATRSGVFVSSASTTIDDGYFAWFAGRAKTVGGSTGLGVGFSEGPHPSCTISVPTGSTYLGVNITTVTGACVSLAFAAQLKCPSLGAAAPFSLISTSGTGIVVDYAAQCDISSRHNFVNGFSLVTGGWGVSVKHGGRICVDHDMFNNITASLGAFTLDELTAITAASLFGSNKLFAMSIDGSIIQSEG